MERLGIAVVGRAFPAFPITSEFANNTFSSACANSMSSSNGSFVYRHRGRCSESRVSKRRATPVCMAPEDEKMTRRSPLDFPLEWTQPKPGRRPDIFPQFSPMKTPLPHPMPADPPEKEEDEEEEKKEEEPDKEPEKPEEGES